VLFKPSPPYRAKAPNPIARDHWNLGFVWQGRTQSNGPDANESPAARCSGPKLPLRQSQTLARNNPIHSSIASSSRKALNSSSDSTINLRPSAQMSVNNEAPAATSHRVAISPTVSSSTQLARDDLPIFNGLHVSDCDSRTSKQ
jgi:hypothetical protein